MMRSRGFSLIEMLITVVIVGILLSIGLPAWQAYLNNSKIRNAAQSFANGIQTARTEAVRRNANVDFVLTDATTLDASATASAMGRGWIIRTSDGATFIEGKVFNEGGRGNTTPIVVNDVNNDGTSDTGAVSTITFTGLGTTTLTANATLTFSNPSGGACATSTVPSPMRCLNVVVNRGGQSKMCDPLATAAGDTRSCS